MDRTDTHGGRVVLVGVDAHVASVDALRWSNRLAEAFGWTVRAVTAWSYKQELDYRRQDWDPARQAAADLAATVRAAFGDHRPAGLTCVTVEGGPLSVLIDEQHRCGAELIVIGASARHDRPGAPGRLAGALIAAARCPVVSVPHLVGGTRTHPVLARQGHHPAADPVTT